MKTEVWAEMAPMMVARADLGVATINGRIYAVGGNDGDKHHTSVECYIPSQNKWISVAAMKERRSKVAVAELNGFLYAIGGCNGRLNKNKPLSRVELFPYLTIVERYDPKLDTWTVVRYIIFLQLRQLR